MRWRRLLPNSGTLRYMTTDHYDLGEYVSSVTRLASRLDAANVPVRLRAHDYTLWSDDTTEIVDRLGWLTLPEDIRAKVEELPRFTETARRDGYRHVVLLGMGGSSLGPEVIRRVIGPSEDSAYPDMHTLDSTVPAWVTTTTAAVDPARTLFVVSSKSGTTTEPLALYAWFRHLANSCVDQRNAGGNFVAVTDPNTPLAKLAKAEGFRGAFYNDPNVGGRYSVLSCFGLVPAALTGVDLPRLLDTAESMQRQCLSACSVGENPGARLGTVIGALARQGCDKLTLIASPRIAKFGLWVEQLLAESTGKNGVGIIPVEAEPLLSPAHYGDDRFFVQLRLEDDDTESTAAQDLALDALSSAGHPVARLEMSEPYDLGAEFYRWEYATAIAGHILGIHPFDQPDVQGAKDRTLSVLHRYQREGRLPEIKTDDPQSFSRLLAEACAGDYLAIMAYLPESPDVRGAIHDLRRRVMEKYRIATTAGYGPRLLHSTGQLHKGGPNTGIFLQLTQERIDDVEIPGWPFTFGVLADAQALGDLQALRELGRRTVSIRLTHNLAAGIRSLAHLL